MGTPGVGQALRDAGGSEYSEENRQGRLELFKKQFASNAELSCVFGDSKF